jgi:hypothetical protein
MDTSNKYDYLAQPQQEVCDKILSEFTSYTVKDAKEILLTVLDEIENRSIVQ